MRYRQTNNVVANMISISKTIKLDLKLRAIKVLINTILKGGNELIVVFSRGNRNNADTLFGCS